MSRITVLGGTGYAGSAIVAEAAGRGHQVTAFSRSLPAEQVPGVTYVQGDATDEAALASAVSGADVVVAALAPRGPLADSFRDVYRTVGRLADAEGARLFVVGGFSSLRPAPGAPRFVEDLSHVPAELHGEILAGAALIIEGPARRVRDARLGVRQPRPAVRVLRPRPAHGCVPGRRRRRRDPRRRRRDLRRRTTRSGSST